MSDESDAVDWLGAEVEIVTSRLLNILVRDMAHHKQKSIPQTVLALVGFSQ